MYISTTFSSVIVFHVPSISSKVSSFLLTHISHDNLKVSLETGLQYSNSIFLLILYALWYWGLYKQLFYRSSNVFLLTLKFTYISEGCHREKPGSDLEDTGRSAGPVLPWAKFEGGAFWAGLISDNKAPVQGGTRGSDIRRCSHIAAGAARHIGLLRLMCNQKGGGSRLPLQKHLKKGGCD